MAKDILFGAFFRTGDPATGKTGLTPTLDVYRVTIADLTVSQTVTDGAMTAVGGGLYAYRVASADLVTYYYYAVAKTADATVLEQHVPAAQLDFSGNTGDTFARIGVNGAGLTALGDARLAGIGSDTPGVTTLLTRLSAARAGYLDMLAGWTGTLLAALRALARKDVAANGDIAGTHDPATDSQEALSETLDTAAVFPAGSVEYTYTVTNSVTGAPLDGVEVQISTDAAGVNIVWSGTTDAFGIARDVLANKPRLNPGTYYFWRQLAGYTFSPEPDSEAVS